MRRKKVKVKRKGGRDNEASRHRQTSIKYTILKINETPILPRGADEGILLLVL